MNINLWQYPVKTFLLFVIHFIFNIEPYAPFKARNCGEDLEKIVPIIFSFQYTKTKTIRSCIIVKVTKASISGITILQLPCVGKYFHCSILQMA